MPSTQHWWCLRFYWERTIEILIFKQYYGVRQYFIVYRFVSERKRQVVIEQTRLLSTVFLCSEIKLENIEAAKPKVMKNLKRWWEKSWREYEPLVRLFTFLFVFVWTPGVAESSLTAAVGGLQKEFNWTGKALNRCLEEEVMFEASVQLLLLILVLLISSQNDS